MMGLIVGLLVLILFFLVWIVMILNNGFSFTNKNIDNSTKKNELLVLKADEVIAKYKRIMIDIENGK